MGTDLEEIKGRLNIVDVLGEYIRLEKAGSNWRALCPFHNEKSPSFMVSEDKQFWHCFGCQKSGDIFSFVMEIEGLSFREALKLLADKAGVKLSGYDPKKTEAVNRTLEILELATKFYEVQLWKGDGKIKIVNYLRERGLKDETIKEFRLGYAPKGWRNVLAFLTKRGFKTEEILKTGLLVKKENSSDCYDRFRERVMFPIADYSGHIVGYSARVAPGGDESQAKYVNTPETEVYHKSRILYGVDKAKSEIKKENFALLVEGNMDVIAASQAGIRNVVAVSGTALTLDQIGIIKRYAPKIKMFFDRDSAGYLATKKSMKLCFTEDMQVEVVSIEGGKDAADIAKEDPEKLKSAVKNSKDAMEYLLDDSLQKFDKNKAEDKRKISELMIEMISVIAGSVEKSHWIKTIAQKLETTETALTDAIKKATLKNRLGKTAERETEYEFVARPKIDVLFDEVIGMILASPDIWKKAAEERQNYAFAPKDSLLNIVLEKGNESGYDHEKLVMLLPEAENRKRAEKLFFQHRYWLGINNELEEVTPKDPLGEFGAIVKEIKKELKKEELEKIAIDLKRAEEIKDKEAIKFLQKQFKHISEEVQNLA